MSTTNTACELRIETTPYGAFYYVILSPHGQHLSVGDNMRAEEFARRDGERELRFWNRKFA